MPYGIHNEGIAMKFLRSLTAYLVGGVMQVVDAIIDNLTKPIPKETVLRESLASLVALALLVSSGAVVLAVNICAPYLQMQTPFVWTLSAMTLKVFGVVGGMTVVAFFFLDFYRWTRLALTSSTRDYLDIRDFLRLVAALGYGGGIVIAMTLTFHPGLVPLEVAAILDALRWVSSMMALIGTEALVFFGLLVVLKKECGQSA